MRLKKFKCLSFGKRDENFKSKLSNRCTYYKNSISSKSQCLDIHLVKMNKNDGIFKTSVAKEYTYSSALVLTYFSRDARLRKKEKRANY